MSEETSNESAFTAKDLHTTSADHMFSGALSMFRRRYSQDLNNADLAILGIPFDTATSNRPGARLAKGSQSRLLAVIMGAALAVGV